MLIQVSETNFLQRYKYAAGLSLEVFLTKSSVHHPTMRPHYASPVDVLIGLHRPWPLQQCSVQHGAPGTHR